MAVRVRDEGHVRIVTIDRPERRNAVDHDTALALFAAFEALDDEPSVRAAILTGHGDTFCAGADLKAVARGELNPVAADGPAPMGPSRTVLRTPVIAAIEGFAVAGGLELALWCDLRVCAEDATLGVFCRRWGVPLIDGGTVRLPRIVGLGRALDLILTGRPIDAAEAHAIGLVNRVVPRGTALECALELATSLTQLPQECMAIDRASAYAAFDQPLPEALLTELERGRNALEEAQRGAARFADGAGRGGVADN